MLYTCGFFFPQKLNFLNIFRHKCKKKKKKDSEITRGFLKSKHYYKQRLCRNVAETIRDKIPSSYLEQQLI